MSELIRFETGHVTYALNDRCEVTFNPTDPNFWERVYLAFEEMDKRQEDYRKEVQAADKRAVLDITRKWDAEMRKLIDELFEADVCAPLFGKTNVYATADGLPLWCNLMLAIMDKAEEVMPKEQSRAKARIAKYTAKYHK